MTNPANNGTLIGRLANEPKPMPNSDGSTTLLFQLGVDEDFVRSGKNQPDTDFVPVRVFIPAKANGLGSWANVHKGDLIAVNTRVSCKRYQKDGQWVYPAPSIEIDGYPRYLEPKTVTSERYAKNQATAQQDQADQPVAAAPAQAAPAAASGDAESERIAALEAELAKARQAAVDVSESPFGS